jgi:hypothetical protein
MILLLPQPRCPFCDWGLAGSGNGGCRAPERPWTREDSARRTSATSSSRPHPARGVGPLDPNPSGGDADAGASRRARQHRKPRGGSPRGGRPLGGACRVTSSRASFACGLKHGEAPTRVHRARMIWPKAPIKNPRRATPAAAIHLPRSLERRTWPASSSWSEDRR